MSETANAVGASAPSAIDSSGVSTSKREFVPTPKVQAQTPKTQSKPQASDPFAAFKGTKHKVNIDGKDAEVDYDELRRGYQKAQASDRRFQEAAQKEKQALAIQSALEQGDLSFLTQKLGKSKAKELMENYLIAEMEEEALPPAEKRARELERRLKEKEDQEKSWKERAEKEEYERNLHKAHAELDKEVGEALKEIGRKPTPRLVIRIVDEMIAKMDAKEEALPAKLASQKAIQGIYSDIAEFLPQLDVSELVKILPSEVIEKIRQYQVDQVLGEKSQRRTKSSGATPIRKEAKKLSTDDWFKNLEKRKFS